jgi:hypothetical protein
MWHVSLPDALTAVGLALTVAVLAYARLAVPKRRLLIIAQPATPLLQRIDHGARISIEYDQLPVGSPHTTVLGVRSTGRNAITTAHFDQGRPIVVDFGVPVIDVLELSGSVTVRSDGTRVLIGPDLIRPTEVIEAHLLTDGSPTLRVSETPVVDHLIDTKVEYVRPGQMPKQKQRVQAALTAAALAAALTLAGWLIWLWTHQPPDAEMTATPAVTSPGSAFTIHIANVPVSSGELYYMGKRERVQLRHGRADVNLLVPPRTNSGSYIAVLLFSEDGYLQQVTTSFQVG